MKVAIRLVSPNRRQAYFLSEPIVYNNGHEASIIDPVPNDADTFFWINWLSDDGFSHATGIVRGEPLMAATADEAVSNLGYTLLGRGVSLYDLLAMAPLQRIALLTRLSQEKT